MAQRLMAPPALQAQIEQEGYDILVMGDILIPNGSNLFLGGTTRSLLSLSSIPVLVSHKGAHHKVASHVARETP
jgi:nucleotide-binding universal stress UspA family protein